MPRFFPYFHFTEALFFGRSGQFFLWRFPISVVPIFAVFPFFFDKPRRSFTELPFLSAVFSMKIPRGNDSEILHRHFPAGDHGDDSRFPNPCKAAPSFSTAFRLIPLPCSSRKEYSTFPGPRYRPYSLATRNTAALIESLAWTARKYCPR